MSTTTPKRATIDDLYRVEGKAELIGGRIVHFMPTGFQPNRVAGRIFRSLDDHAEAIGRGFAFTDNMGFTVPELPSGRESFCPDASYYVGPVPKNAMRFVEGPPTFAVEVRSETDHGPAAERAMAAKRADYFAAGTVVVWDVDPEAGVVRVYRASEPDRPATYGRGERAEAEPAVPGWQVEVDRVLGTA
jgi:Uma2 family endonuclease